MLTQHYLSFLVISWGGGLYIYKVVVIVTHQVTFHPNFNLRDNISSQLADK